MRYKSPTKNEIAMLLLSANGEPPARRDIRGHLFIPVGFIQIDTQNPICDPMNYPLLFPNGETGWHSNMSYTTTKRREKDEATAATMDVDEEQEDVFHWVGERLPSTTKDQPADEAEEPNPKPDKRFDDEENDPQRLNRVSTEKASDPMRVL